MSISKVVDLMVPSIRRTYRIQPVRSDGAASCAPADAGMSQPIDPSRLQSLTSEGLWHRATAPRPRNQAMTDRIEVTLDGSIATLWLNRPERGNAIDGALMQALITAAESVSAREEVRVVIVRGRGRHFSVGADLKAPPPAEPPTLQTRRRTSELGAKLMRALQEIRQPTLCAVHGVAHGGGACIATACDFRIAADDARLGYGEVRLGMPLMWHALPLCVRLIGPARAKQMVMSGKAFDAAILHSWGYLDELVAPGHLESRALAWAEEFAALPPVAVQMIKRSVNALSSAMDAAVMHMDADQFLLASRSADYREGIAAFLEKRTPEFRGD
jgi:enoyl-CoA hydratase/carnithine racemase